MTRYAYVASGSIGNVYYAGQQYTDKDGNVYPSAVWRKPDWIKKQGLREIIPIKMPDPIFYKASTGSLSYDSSSDVVKESITTQERSVADIKETLIIRTRSAMTTMVATTDYHLTRKSEDSDYTVPSDVTAYRESVYTKHDAYIDAINGATTFKQLKALMLTSTADDKGKVTTKGQLWDWPEVPDGVG